MKTRVNRIITRISSAIIKKCTILHPVILLAFVSPAIVILSLTFFQCSKAPSDYNDNYYPITLSLEKNGRDSAEYSGTPILVTLELKDTIPFSDIAWRTGNGKLIIPENMTNKISNKFEVYLYWLLYPARKDTAAKLYIDTIYVSTGGNLNVSNQVRVKVLNLPVVVDSAKVGDVVFSGLDQTWRWATTRPVSVVPFRIYARDLDGKIPDISFADNKGKIVQSDPRTLQYLYYVPQGVVFDTVSINIYDHYGSNIFRNLIMKRYVQSNPPVIDSILINGKNIRYTNGSKIAFASFDTLAFSIYAHDPENTQVTYTWSAADSSRLKKVSLNTKNVLYICDGDSCATSITDTSFLIDTIKFTAYDEDEDSTLGKVFLYKGVFNELPVIDSISVADSVFHHPGTSLRYPVLLDSSVAIKIWARDPEGEKIQIQWKPQNDSVLSDTTGTESVYTAGNKLGLDIIKVLISDGSKSTTFNLRLSVTDGTPVFDSLVVGNAGFFTIFKGTDQLFHYAKTVFDTFPVAVYASPSTAHGTLVYGWSANDSTILNKIVDNRAQIILPGTEFKDTINVVISDGLMGYTLQLEVSGI